MSKINNDWYDLPSLQKKILMHLARNGPLTRNEVTKRVGKATKNVLFSFKSLEDKELIQVVGQKFYRQREFPRYWLTVIGVALSILHDVEPEKIELLIDKKYPQAEEMMLIASLSKVLGKKALGLALRTVLTYPIKDAVGKLSVLVLMDPKRFADKDSLTLAKDVEKALRPFPEYHEQALNTWERLSQLSNFASEIKKRRNES